MHYCPVFTLTWYPGEYPSTASPRVLQAEGHYVSEGYAGLAGSVRDVMQVQDFFRAASPAIWNRGNRQTSYEWEEVRRYSDPGEALAAGLDAIATMPDETGWLSITVPAQGRAWAVIPCGIESLGFPQVARDGNHHILRLRWGLLCGPATEIAITAEEGAITTEIGTEILTEDGDYYLALESIP